MTQLSTIRPRDRWMALIAALLGWMFDGVEMGVFSLVGRPALTELLGDSDDARIGLWMGIITAGFLVGAATGGVLFGWLGDRIGRVHAMMLSVLTYALFTGCCGFAQTAEHVFGLRFIASLGMGGEWALGVALVMEVWPNRSRAALAALIGAASNVGFLLIAVLGLCLASVMGSVPGWLSALGLSDATVRLLTDHQGWRLLMISGALPALLTLLIRLFVPESEKWEQERARGTTRHWATRDLLAVVVAAAGVLGAVYLWGTREYSWQVCLAATLLAVAVATAGYLYPVARFVQRAEPNQPALVKKTLLRMLLAAGLSGVALLGTWASLQWAPAWVDRLTQGALPEAKSWTQICSAGGAVFGSATAALVANWLGRRWTYRLMCLGSFGSILLLYRGTSQYGNALLAAVFLAGFFTASFYGWLALYLPELFSTRLRATAQGFGYNFGRIVAAIGTLQTGNLMEVFNGDYAHACSVMSVVYLFGLGLIALAPETRGQSLPE